MIIFSKDALDYHTKILITPFDGSIANSYSKINATMENYDDSYEESANE